MCQFNNARMSGYNMRGPGAAHQHGFGRFARHFAGGWQDHSGQVPVNVRETIEAYEIFVYAPGLSKEAFQVGVTDDVLHIRFQADNKEAANENWLHREYNRTSFERQFLLNGKVDTTAINARYTDGVLQLTLPKLPGAPEQQISVA